MAKIKGITVILIDKEPTGKDPLGKITYSEKEIPVENVLVTPTSFQESGDIISQVNLTGRFAHCTLGIPKGDANNWENREVLFFGERWKTVGIPMQGIEDMIPLDWNKKVMVERYE